MPQSSDPTSQVSTAYGQMLAFATFSIFKYDIKALTRTRTRTSTHKHACSRVYILALLLSVKRQVNCLAPIMTSTTIPHQPHHARQLPVERAAVGSGEHNGETRLEMSSTTTDLLHQAAARGAGEVVEKPTVSRARAHHLHARRSAHPCLISSGAAVEYPFSIVV